MKANKKLFIGNKHIAAMTNEELCQHKDNSAAAEELSRRPKAKPRKYKVSKRTKIEKGAK